MRGECCFILPPNLLARFIDTDNEGRRRAAIGTGDQSAKVRARRELLTQLIVTRGLDLAALGLATKALNRTVFDVNHGGWNDLPGAQVRIEGGPASNDDAVNQ